MRAEFFQYARLRSIERKSRAPGARLRAIERPLQTPFVRHRATER
jgi:hypothetical protein